MTLEVTLKKKPKSPIIIEGFPGFGLIGTIATEFLIEELKAELIGGFKLQEMPAMVAIHESKLVQPMGIFYDKKNNLVILHIVTPLKDVEWKIATAIRKLAKDVKAKEIISVEGVSSPEETTESRCFYYTNDQAAKKRFEKIDCEPLREGIIIGVTGALMLEAEESIPLSAIFAETHSALPDSKAAAKIIDTLNAYLNLRLETKPLLKQAERFEEKLKNILHQSKLASEEQEKKKMTYVG